MAASLGECEVRNLSRHALHQRMKLEVIEFLETVLKHVGLSTLDMKEDDESNPFRRIISRACVDSYRDDFLRSRDSNPKMGSKVEASSKDQRGCRLRPLN